MAVGQGQRELRRQMSQEKVHRHPSGHRSRLSGSRTRSIKQLVNDCFEMASNQMSFLRSPSPRQSASDL